MSLPLLVHVHQPLELSSIRIPGTFSHRPAGTTVSSSNTVQGMNEGAVGLIPPSSPVSAVRSCRSFWRSSFYSHLCLSSNSLHSSVHRPVRDPSTALNHPSTAACTEFKSLSAADTCSSVSSCFRANLSMCSNYHLAKSSSCSLCLSIFLQQGSHLLFQPTFCSGSHSVSTPLLTPICTVLGIPDTGTQQTCTGSKQLWL